MTEFRKKYDEYRSFFEGELAEYCKKMNYRPPLLAESMRYSLLSGGKRVRPVLFFGALERFGGDYRAEAGSALALECVHTYSLIHDDLPAMDDDDFRRGNPSNHKVFGEANAILAGDALLNEAAILLFREAKRGEKHLRAAAALMEGAGAGGMIAGQSADLAFTGKEGTEEDLAFIYENKTGKLLEAPARMAAILTGADEENARRFGRELGILFQLTDDVLDEKGESEKMGKTLGKDREAGKFTCVKLFGLSRSEALADRAAASCLAALRDWGGATGFLEDLVELVRTRDN